MPKLLEFARLLTIGPKNPIPKKKRKIIKKAEEEIDKLEKLKTARTRAIEKRQTGVESDIEKKKKRVARQARSVLMAGKGR